MFSMVTCMPGRSKSVKKEKKEWGRGKVFKDKAPKDSEVDSNRASFRQSMPQRVTT